jgi:hypothetical protein
MSVSDIRIFGRLSPLSADTPSFSFTKIESKEEEKMAKVNIIIRGVALCYQKSGVWKVMFPFDQCHQVKLIQQTSDETQVPLGTLADANNTIEIQTQGATSSTGTDSSFNQIFDLTGSNAHSSGVKPIISWQTGGVLLTIPNAVFHLHGAYQVDFILSGNGSEINVGKIGHSSIAKIDLAQTGSISVISGGSEVFSHNGDTPCTLIFDNDCPPVHTDTGLGDFNMFYDIIEDSANSSRTFELNPSSPLPSSEPCQNVRASITTDLA